MRAQAWMPWLSRTLTKEHIHTSKDTEYCFSFSRPLVSNDARDGQIFNEMVWTIGDRKRPRLDHEKIMKSFWKVAVHKGDHSGRGKPKRSSTLCNAHLHKRTHIHSRLCKHHRRTYNMKLFNTMEQEYARRKRKADEKSFSWKDGHAEAGSRTATPLEACPCGSERATGTLKRLCENPY